MKKYPQIIGFINSFSHGKSGGDMVFIEVLKRIPGYRKVIITSLLGKELCTGYGLRGTYFITSNETEFKYVIWIYLKRILNAVLLKFEINRQDIVLSSSDFLPDVLPAFILKLKNRNTFWIQHIFHLIPPNRKLSALNQRISFFLIKLLANHIFVDNTKLKEDLVRLGFKKEKITVNHPGIDHDLLKKAVKREESYDAVFMAQLRPSKGIDDLVKIWKMVCKKLPESKLAVMGKGNKEMELAFMENCKRVGIEKNVNFLGFLPDKEAFSVIKSSRVFLFPSNEEGFGIAGLEAQALGLPVVAWNLPVFEEIFTKGMIKVKIGDFHEFADAVIGLYKEKDYYDKISLEAVSNSNRFNWDLSAKRELNIINKLNK